MCLRLYMKLWINYSMRWKHWHNIEKQFRKTKKRKPRKGAFFWQVDQQISILSKSPDR